LCKKHIRKEAFIGEQELASLILLKFKKRLNVPIVSDLHNFWAEELVENGSIRKYSKRYAYFINLEKIIRRKMMKDTVGHYNRFDILRLYLNTKPHYPLISQESVISQFKDLSFTTTEIVKNDKTKDDDSLNQHLRESD